MSKSARESMLLNNHEVYSISGDLHDNFEQPLKFTCHGLMLCEAKDHSRLVVWNPYRVFALEYSNSQGRRQHMRGEDFYKYDLRMENFLLNEENRVAVCCGKYQDDNGRCWTMIHIYREDMYKLVYQDTANASYLDMPLVITYVPSLVRIP
ncbi:hypothetical protein N665_0738s0015 [Sinapis alba]|nr:hypothetical protein N665_0738s0015 [Sinapis alba]